jgi:hypothetical protein
MYDVVGDYRAVIRGDYRGDSGWNVIDSMPSMDEYGLGAADVQLGSAQVQRRCARAHAHLQTVLTQALTQFLAGCLSRAPIPTPCFHPRPDVAPHSAGWALGNFKGQSRGSSQYKAWYADEPGMLTGRIWTQLLRREDYGCSRTWVAVRHDAAAPQRARRAATAVAVEGESDDDGPDASLNSASLWLGCCGSSCRPWRRPRLWHRPRPVTHRARGDPRPRACRQDRARHCRGPRPGAERVARRRAASRP